MHASHGRWCITSKKSGQEKRCSKRQKGRRLQHSARGLRSSGLAVGGKIGGGFGWWIGGRAEAQAGRLALG